MTPFDLAQILVDAHPEERGVRLRENSSISPIEIAEALQQMCYEAWTEDPQRVSAIAEAINFLVRSIDNKEVTGFAEWVNAIRDLVNGELVSAIGRIDRSESIFSEIGKFHLAAKTQTSKIYCLAMLGRYDEAVNVGERALNIFLEQGDLYSAGKTEHNIGNLYWRRDMYRQAEPHLESARLRFVAIGDQRQIAMVENCQAFVKTLQNQFREAEAIYKSALDRAETNGLTVTEAEIETGLSNLYLFEAKYDLALKFMERSRQKYQQMEMPNQSAICELEIADIYLELNLLPEAVEFYTKVAVHLAEFGLQAELARCWLGHARALIRLNERDAALDLLDKAEGAYVLEGNLVAAGSVQLARSRLLFDQHDLEKAGEQVDLALAAFEQGENLRLSLFARWLRAKILYASGQIAESITEFEATLSHAKEQFKDVEYLCLTSLGRKTENEKYLESAIELVENSRASLALDELRTSYFAEKITPYHELIKLKLSKRQFEDAFYLHERSRSRSLVEQLRQPENTVVSDERLAGIREELNWYYSRIKRSSLAGNDERARVETLRKRAFELENEYSELLRRLGVSDQRIAGAAAQVDLGEIRPRLDETTLVEFVAIDGRITAFVVSKDGFSALPNYADEAELNNEIKHFLFQIKTGRFIDRLSDKSRAAAFERLLSHSTRIYDILLRPLGHLLKTERIVFAPSGLMHYLPFHALHTGKQYLIEQAEISYTPSISVLDHCLKKPLVKPYKALIVGIADALTPMVDAEIEAVAQFFCKTTRLTGPQATVEKIRQNVGETDVFHFACHGKFRPDNPGFSSLSLFEEELTVNEVRNLALDNSFIILSACETGLNDVVRGEELIGLTRAFFSAGARTLVLSLWRVDDQITLELMTAFYQAFSNGMNPSESLRLAQRQLIKRNLHPYLWSPFLVSGHW